MGGILNLYWHRSINFGDMLSPYLLAKLKGVSTDEIIYTEPDSQEQKYVLTGSILSVPVKNAIIFGPGFVSEDDKFTAVDINIKGVRGIRSLNKLNDYIDVSNIILGDPGLLLPYYYNPKPEKKYKVGIVPHISDYEKTKGDFVIDLRMGDETITETVERGVYQICQCESILSSSLHGLVVAKAYGIPFEHFHSCSLVGDGFKFRDFLETEVEVNKLYEGFNYL